MPPDNRTHSRGRRAKVGVGFVHFHPLMLKTVCKRIELNVISMTRKYAMNLLLSFNSNTYFDATLWYWATGGCENFITVPTMSRVTSLILSMISVSPNSLSTLFSLLTQWSHSRNVCFSELMLSSLKESKMDICICFETFPSFFVCLQMLNILCLTSSVCKLYYC